MRIAVNARFLLKDKLEGIGWFTYEVVQRLTQRHPEHEFILFFDRLYHASFVFNKNVMPVVLPPPARHPLLWWWWFEISIPKALKKYKADVFLSPDGYCSLRTKTPTVMVTHDIAYVHTPAYMSALMYRYFQYFVPKFMQRAERIVTVSEYSKQDILQHFKLLPEKVTVAYNGCRTVFQPLHSTAKKEIQTKYAAGQDYFFYVGAVHPRKNVHRLIQAFDQFKIQTQSPIKLLIGGRFAWQTGEVKDAYEQAYFKNDIQLLGYVSDAELPLLTGGALALVYVSLFEGFGVPLLEAMNCDVPIITSNVTSLPEVAGDAALLVNPYDVNEIAKAMQALHENPALRQHLIAKGKIQRKKFTWEKAADVVWESLKSGSEP